MTKDKLKSVLLFYKEYLEGKRVKNKSANYDRLGPTKEEAYGHILSMISRAEDLLKANELEKTFRWLGFIQGALWMTGDFTLNNLKNHSKPTQED